MPVIVVTGARTGIGLATPTVALIGLAIGAFKR